MTNKDMPEEIYVCGVGWKAKEGFSATSCPDSYSHHTKYKRADLTLSPDDIKAVREALEMTRRYYWDDGDMSFPDKETENALAILNRVTGGK